MINKDGIVNKDIAFEAIDVDVNAMFDAQNYNEFDGKIDSHKNTINAGNSVISEE